MLRFCRNREFDAAGWRSDRRLSAQKRGEKGNIDLGAQSVAFARKALVSGNRDDQVNIATWTAAARRPRPGHQRGYVSHL